MNPKDVYIDESLISTPKPTATSTITKKNEKSNNVEGKRVQIPLNYSLASEGNASSLGVLNLDDLEFGSTHAGENFSMNRLNTQRMLAKSVIERANKTAGLPSKYFKADSMWQKTKSSYHPDNSTVNESDLINRKESVNSQSFYPNDVSTPRTSEVAEKPLESSMFQGITDMSEKIRNSDISLHDICSQLHKANFERFSSVAPVSGIDSQVFMPAELLTEKLLKDEMSWRREKDVPFEKLRESIMSMVDGNSEKTSIGDFFKMRSNELKDLFKTKSPEKLHVPVPLIDITNISNISVDEAIQDASTRVVSETNNSIPSITLIGKALSELECSSPNKIVEHLLQSGKGDKSKTKTSATNKRRSLSINNENCPAKPSIIKLPKENDCDDYMTKKQSQHNRSKSSLDYTRHISPTRDEIKDADVFTRSSSPYQRFEQITSDARSSTKSPELMTSIKSFESTNSSKLRYGPTLSMQSSSVSTAKDNKENMCDNASVGSRCPSSLESIPEGKLPIKGNKLEIIWGCLKVGRSNVQSCCIRNQLNQKIRIQVSVTGSCFRIVKERGDVEMLTSIIFILHPLETKAISIMFHPKAIGAVYGRLNFCPISNGEVIQNLTQTIRLYAYGGHASVEMTKVAKDSTGKLWLSLGLLALKPVINQQFTIKNNGVLPAFAMMELIDDYTSKITSVNITPKKVVIRPQEEITVALAYTTNRHDYKNQEEIIDVGSIKIVTSAEVTRGRLRRLYTMLAERNEPIDPLIVKLSKKFPNEKMPSDLSTLTESTATIKELLQQLTMKEIRLTIDRDPDSTLVGPVTDFEDTTLYQTLYQDCPINVERNMNTNTTNVKFLVEPSSIFFSLPYKTEDTILLHSKSSTPMTYEVAATNGFKVSPTKGTISSGNMVVIRISCIEVPPSGRGKVSVSVENEVVEISLKAIFITK